MWLCLRLREVLSISIYTSHVFFKHVWESWVGTFFFRPPMPQNVKGVEEIKLHFESTEQTSCNLMLLICSSSRSCRVVFFAPSESNLREILFWLTDISPQKFGLQLSQTEQKVCVSFPPKGFIHSYSLIFLGDHPSFRDDFFGSSSTSMSHSFETNPGCSKDGRGWGCNQKLLTSDCWKLVKVDVS